MYSLRTERDLNGPKQTQRGFSAPDKTRVARPDSQIRYKDFETGTVRYRWRLTGSPTASGIVRSLRPMADDNGQIGENETRLSSDHQTVFVVLWLHLSYRQCFPKFLAHQVQSESKLRKNVGLIALCEIVTIQNQYLRTTFESSRREPT